MASQQGAPSRPWFRLATMARPPPPTQQPPDQPPAPAPAPPQPIARPPFIRPAFTQPPPPSQPQPQAPPSRPMAPSSNPPRTPPLQQPSPKTIKQATSSPPKTLEKTPPPSPKTLSHPPSPLALPSPQLKSYDAPPQYDQKTVLVQDKPKPKFDHNTSHNPKNGSKKPQASKNHLDSEDLGMTIITISGENKGAIMDLTPLGNKTTHKFGTNPHTLHMKKDNNNNPSASSDAEKSGTNSDSKSNSKAKKKKNHLKSPLMSSAVMNSNVQAVNNSILYNCSTTHHDPGIHLSLSRTPTAAPAFLHKDHIN